MSNKQLWFSLTICLLMVFIQSCGNPTVSKPTTTPYDERVVPQITLPSTVPGLIAVLQGDNAEARIQAARVLLSMREAAEPAVSALTQNLYYENFEVRKVSAEALGKIGPAAESSIPVLIVTLLKDPFIHARRSAAGALGEIESAVAVPALAAALTDEDTWVQIEAASSLEKLTGQDFSDKHTLDQDGVPIIVASAREWWENEGRYLDWSSTK